MVAAICLLCLFIASPANSLMSLDSVARLTRSYGLEFRTYRIVTQDRYFLTLFRIQQRFLSKFGNKQPVLLHHGLVSSGVSFMMNGDKSLAFYLARQGYDVWLANHRGNNFSPGHAYLRMNDPKYWDFSFHEIGMFDVPAAVEFIYKMTGSKLHYIGHSMGTTVSFVYCSMRPYHAQRFLKSVVALAPVTSMKYSLGGLRAVAPFVDTFLQSLLSRSVSVVFPRPGELSSLMKIFCLSNVKICESLFVLFNGNNHQYFGGNITKLFHYNPSRSSIKCLAHYVQLVLSQTFQQYDYKKYNKLRYKNFNPPQYNLQNIRVPVHLFYSLKDVFVSPKDARVIYDQLRVKKSLNLVPNRGNVQYYHTDYILGKDADAQVNRRILKKFIETS